MLVVDNGHQLVRLIPTRGMGILDVQSKTLRLGWDSPVQEVTHPNSINLESRGGTGWLEGFNEYLVRCGLEWCGPPAEDDHHLAKAEPPVGRTTLHGKIANIPASELSVEIETKSPWRIRVHSMVREAMMYGPKFQLKSTFETRPGESGFSVTDTVANLGGQTQEFQLLYHLNHGVPLLEAGSRWLAPLKWSAPRDAESAKGLKSMDKFDKPKSGSLEKAFLCQLHADRRGQTGVVLQNEAADRGVHISWPQKALPCFTVWKAEHPPADGYVCGLEPGTNYPNPRSFEGEQGRVQKIKAGGEWSARLQFDSLEDRTAVAQANKIIRAIAKGKKADAQKEPVL